MYFSGNFTQEASLTRQRYAERTGQTATAARAALSRANRKLYRCDPQEYTKGMYCSHNLTVNNCFNGQFIIKFSICYNQAMSCRTLYLVH